MDHPKDILSFVFQRADATQTFWNFFATVATAILGFVAAAKLSG
jgi:ABC-type nitrate/sulfonate/bicarbonate transport system permease component